jgi:hypothetical protein
MLSGPLLEPGVWMRSALLGTGLTLRQLGRRTGFQQAICTGVLGVTATHSSDTIGPHLRAADCQR